MRYVVNLGRHLIPFSAGLLGNRFRFDTDQFSIGFLILACVYYICVTSIERDIKFVVVGSM